MEFLPKAAFTGDTGTRMGTSAEIIANEQCLVSREDHAAPSEGLRRLKDSPEEQRALGRLGPERAIEIQRISAG